MKILHLLPSKAAIAAGLASAVNGLAAAQKQCGLESVLLASDDVARLRRASGLMADVYNALREISLPPSDLIHSHGLWLAPSRASRRLRRRGLPTVVAPHGMLDPWAWRRRRALKQLLWWLGEERTVQQASCLQALCRSEAQAIRQLGITAPVALIPNGVALPDRSPVALQALPPAPWLAHGLPAGVPVLLFLGRFHAKKGLQPLLQAWQGLQASQASSAEGAWLVFAGFGDAGTLADQLQRSPIPRVCVLGPLHGSAKASAYAHAAGFVLPSFSEGLPMAALEAMSWGLPCLLSAACNLPEAFAAGAAWPAPADAEQLLPVLQRWQRNVLLDRTELQAMGAAGRELVATRFCWDQVARQTDELYGWLLRGGSPPSWVELGC